MHTHSGKQYFVNKAKARIADLERQLLPHKSDDVKLRPTVTRLEVQVHDLTPAVVEHLESQLRAARSALARYEASERP